MNHNDDYYNGDSQGYTLNGTYQGNSNGAGQNGQNSYGYGQNGQNPYGYGQQGQNPYGYGQQGQNPYGYGQQGQNPYGYGQQGQNPYGYSPNGQNPYGNGQPGQNPYGYSQNGYYGSQSKAPAFAIGDVLSMSFMFMFIALLITGITSLYIARSGLFWTLISSIWVFIILEFAVVIGASAAIKHNNAVLSAILFFAYSVINGVTLSVIFYAYDLSSITTVFFLTAGIFGIMAIYGACTKKDLTSMGSLLFMGLLGIILAGVINIFLQSSGLDFVICIVGVLIFIGLIAYDTQKIKVLAQENTGYSVITIGMWGALELYLDFINLFLKLLRLFGRSRN